MKKKRKLQRCKGLLSKMPLEVSLLRKYCGGGGTIACPAEKKMTAVHEMDE